MITVQELLFNRGLDKTASIKLVRHKDKRQDLYNLYRQIESRFEYQMFREGGYEDLIERVYRKLENGKKLAPMD